MLCKDVQKLLGASALDDLDFYEHHEILNHCTKCTSCNQELTRLQRTLSGIRDLPVVDTSAERRERALDQMRRTHEKTTTRRKRFWFALRVASLTMAASVLVSFVSAYYLFAKPSSQSLYQLRAGAISGHALIQHNGTHSWSSVTSGTVARAGDWIATDASGIYTFTLTSAQNSTVLGEISMNTNTKLKLSGTDSSGQTIFLLLDRGEIRGTLKPMGSRRLVIIGPDNDTLILTGGAFEAGLRYWMYSRDPAAPVSPKYTYTISREGIKLSSLLEWVQTVTGRTISCASPPLAELYVNFYSNAAHEQEGRIDPVLLLADLESELERQNLALVHDKDNALKVLAFVRDPVGGSIRGKLYVRGVTGSARLIGAAGEFPVAPDQEGWIDRTGLPRVINH